MTRRGVLRLGAGALALSALRAPAAALAARPALFEMPIPDGGDASAASWRTTPVLRAPRRFDMIGLRWVPGADVEAQVRARRRGGRWTEWVALHAIGAHAPDGQRAPAGTEPAFTGAADDFQLRLRGSARHLRARFVRALPTASVARRLGARLRARAAQGGVSRPAIISRSEWGGDTVIPRDNPVYGVVEVAFVHHTVNANSYGPEESAAIVLGIARFHRDSNGWNDIGYNFLVDRYGQVFEGRAGGIEAAVVGAQAQGYNAQSTGIACIGTFTSVAETEAGMDALARLIGWKLSLHGVPVGGKVTVTSTGGPLNRYREGAQVTLHRVSGHRDGDRTECPGDKLYHQLAALRRRAAAYAGPLPGITVESSAHQIGAAPMPVEGVLRFADGASPAGAAVAIEYAAGGSAWTPVARATCAADGAWSSAVALPASGQLRAVFAGDATRPPIESAPIEVEVIPRLTLTSDRRRVRAGRLVRVSGTLAPASVARVTCLLERRIGRRWVRVQRKRVAVRAGRFTTRVRLRRAGRYRVTVSAAGAVRRRQLRALRR